MSVAIVTGAASGMGRACAERFLAEGYEVAALDRAEADSGEALAIELDVTDAPAVTAAVAHVASELGPIDAVVNAAGIYPPTTLETATVELYRRTFDVNVLGTLLVTQAAAPHFADGAAVVNFASIDAFVPSPGQLLYCASKAAVVALTRSLALELAPRVRVNALAPGWVDTPGNRTTGRMEEALAAVPLGRAATPEEMADLVWFLAGGGGAAYVTGETLTATGGSAFR
ncbi:SDR family oxidoreductase [Solirubrobacter phytolaccae]|uniref:SDR family oxidoreductase n=1 Tax=Solirubrobacter phytolaccae TaxID=1404360 RepID=A0A9X3SA27_9ACTN|nr:SDR family oxidoreductase [Solirubrobacter phytolaccae]MDA0179855.1 SDR family oxidoreductase [Solirubrobacter phytolaccae]